MPNEEDQERHTYTSVTNWQLYDKLSDVDRKVDRIDQRVTEVVLTRLARVEDRLDRYDSKFESINKKVYGFLAGAGIAVAAVLKLAGVW